MTLNMNLRLLLLALTASLPLLSLAQVGNGVVFYSEANLAFTPTTVDSTTILTVELGNEVGVAQTVSLSGLDGPFSLLGSSEITIGSEASSTLNLAFAPTSLGNFTDTLHAQGAVFGEADIVLSGEGIQVLLEWSADTLYFDTTAIGATSYQDLIITNVGNGTAAITDVIIDNDAFSVEFLDPYVPPTPQAPCYTIPANDYGGDFDVPYREFYLTIEGGTFPDNLYWNIYDPWGAHNYDQWGPVTDFPICLPDNWNLPTNPEEFCCYNYFEFYTYHDLYNPVFTDGIVFTIRDEWDNEVWTFDLGDWPGYEYGDPVSISSTPPEGPDFTPGLIGEGLSTIARVSMTPSNSGDVNGSLAIQNSSAASPTIHVSLIGSAVSEVGGEVCNIQWNPENSPYTFSSDVTIPEGCSLEILGLTEINMNGNSLIVDGELNCSANPGEEVVIESGWIRFGDGPLTTLQGVKLGELPNQQEETTPFHNSPYLLTCERESGTIITGTTGNSCGCEALNSDYSSYGHPSSYSDYSGYLRSDCSEDGYFYLTEPYIATADGAYSVSFSARTNSNYPGEALTLELWNQSMENWETVDSVGWENSAFDAHRLFYGSANYVSGDTVKYRIHHHNTNDISTFIDNLRIGPKLSQSYLSEMDLNINPSLEIVTDEIVTIENDNISFDNDNQGSTDWTSENYPELLTAPTSGYLFMEVVSSTYSLDRYCYWYLEAKSSSSSWYRILERVPYSDQLGQTEEFAIDRVHLPFSVSAGERIDLRIVTNTYSGNSEYNNVSGSIAAVRLFEFTPYHSTSRPLSLVNVESSGWQSTSNYFSLDSCQIQSGPKKGLVCLANDIALHVEKTTIREFTEQGIYVQGEGNSVTTNYSFITNNGTEGIRLSGNCSYTSNNSLIAYNNGTGIYVDGPIDMNYSNVISNGGTGMYSQDFSTINNSIIWFNGGVPQMGTSNTYAASYTNVQGINALLTSTEFAWGDGCIGTDPVLADSLGHLDPFSPCVDGGMPWEQDAHIPYGLGSSRADMGMYGGPANAYWGGQAPPDGAVVITDIFDIPQDQGGQLGMHFTASPFDFGGLGFNVTHYSVWRDLSLGSDVPTIVGDGNWEQIGMVPAQGFGQYGYTAETLVDATPGDTTCLSSFIVIAHTTDDNIYWVSDVAAACSYDNLAPLAPELDGDVLLEEPDSPVVVVSWPAPEEDDYAYTVIERADGVSTNVVGDTLLLDADVEVGLTYNYMGYHLDLNGNPSDTAYVSVTVGAERDVIPLNAGWNLVSLDRSPEEAEVASVMAELMPGNLLYVTGFDAGATFYDPNGLPFLNTLSALEDGYGYWIKVAADDTLRVEGSALPAGLMPTLGSGWNLIAYTAQGAATPETVFADLLADESLEYVTGFDGGVQFFDPAGLPFLNSLEFMQNGFGYWVKTDADYEGMAVDGAAKATPNPNYIILNGTSNLDAHAGQTVAVVTAEGDAVAEMAILEGGHLMTTAVYGAGPSGLDGIAVGEPLYLEFGGERTEAVATWTGDMAHVKLDVQFDGPAFSVFPNPATDWIDVHFDLTESGNAAVDVLDAAGRLVTSQPLGLLLDGKQQVGVSTADLVPGAYQVRLVVDGRTVHTIAMQRIR